MAKKQKSFADKASGNKNENSVYVKYVKSVQSKETGGWRFNEQILQMQKGEQLDVTLNKKEAMANLVDIDLSEFSTSKEMVENDSHVVQDGTELSEKIDNSITEEE